MERLTEQRIGELEAMYAKAVDRCEATAEEIGSVWSAFPAIAAEARKGLQQRWIPVSERLPEEDVLVEVYAPPVGEDDHGFSFDMRHADSWLDWFNNCERGQSAGLSTPDELNAPYTHWRMLDKPNTQDGGTGG